MINHHLKFIATLGLTLLSLPLPVHAQLQPKQLIAQTPQRPAEATTLVGRVYRAISIPNQQPTYRNLPAGFSVTGGWVVDARNPQSLMVGTGRMNNKEFVFLEQKLEHQTARQNNGIANFQVIKILDVIAIPAGTTPFPGCEANQKKLPRAFGVLRPSTNETPQWFTQFAQVWQVNVQTRKFEPVTIPGIRCENPSYGV